jgi:hypothetical protein
VDERRPTGKPPPPEVLQAALDLWRQDGTLHRVPVRGQSMLPLLRPGDSVLVAHGAPLVPGDVLVYRREGQLVAHRLIRPAAGEGRACLAQGDNLLEPDAPVEADEIVGRVIAIQREGRTLRLDTTAWRLAGCLAALVMRAGARPGWVYVRRGIRRFLGLQLRAWLAVAGRWQA